jgi:hypothetical protein
MITTTINAYEGHDVVTVDIPGAFLKTEQDDNNIIHVKLCAVPGHMHTAKRA